MAFTIFIRGIPEKPEIKDVRVLPVPDFDQQAMFRAPVNSTAQTDQVVIDPKGKHFQGQVYKWFHLLFPDGRQGWVRDDLLDVQSDLTPFGYSNYAKRTFAFVAGTGVTPNTVPMATAPAAPPTTIATTPTVPAQPAPAPTPPAARQPTGVSVPTGGPTCSATIRADLVEVKVRAEPSILSEKLSFLSASTPITIFTVKPGTDGGGFRWVLMTANDTSGRPISGFVREDLITFDANCNVFGLTTAMVLNPADPNDTNRTQRFPPPMAAYRITQKFGNAGHRGTDLGVAVGTPVLASGNGVVTKVVQCTRCTESKPNFASQGVPDWDANAIKDPAWGFGFGNYVIVRYAWADMPNIMRNHMSTMGLTNGFAYVIYAHLSRLDVTPGNAVRTSAQLGLSGNTGNSTGPHLHLEVRVSMSANETDLVSRQVMDPAHLYLL